MTQMGRISMISLTNHADLSQSASSASYSNSPRGESYSSSASASRFAWAMMPSAMWAGTGSRWLNFIE